VVETRIAMMSIRLKETVQRIPFCSVSLNVKQGVRAPQLGTAALAF
jgi:hypothetical protein